jgi:hypothetical protein
MPKKYKADTEYVKVVVEEKPQPATIRIAIRSMYPARLRYTSPSTGELYEWLDAGSVVEVVSEDVPFLLSKKLGSSGCCGVKSDGNQLFEQL